MAFRPHIRHLGAAGIAAAAVMFLLAPATAQFFDERFPFDSRPRGSLFGPPVFPQQPPKPVDYSRAPAPKKYEKSEGVDLSTVLVMGDSMADWLGYGLEQAFADSPELTVVRKPRAFSSLIFNPGRHDIRNRNTDWPVAAQEILSKETPSFVVMMIGLGDREPIRDLRPPAAKPATPVQKPQGQANPAQVNPGQTKPAAAPPASAAAAVPAVELRPTLQDTDTERRPQEPETANASTEPASSNDYLTIAAPEPQRPASGAFEFKSEKWVELYTKRVDETIAALKAKGVPVFWVGLPPVRGTRSMSEIAFLNDIYRSRAEKAGVVYIDVWDGFVDESNRFTPQGPDFEGQIRRLRANDGVHFTQAGARKLAHYLDKEIRRAMTPTGPVAIPIPVDPAASQNAIGTAPTPGVATPRPLAGPVIPLNASAEATDSDELAGATGARQSLSDAVATRVLVRGEPLPAPAGRADDFTWPRRAPAPLGVDPVVATTTLPMTPMVAERPAGVKAAAAATATSAAARQARAPRPPGAIGPAQTAAQAQAAQREVQNRRAQSPFFFFFSR